MELPLRIRPVPLVLIAILLLFVSSSIGTGQGWFDPIAVLLFLLGISVSFTPLIYGALLLSFVVDLLYAEPLGATAVYYLLITYLAYRSKRHVNVKGPAGIFILALAIFALSYAAWFVITREASQGLGFPFVIYSLILSAFVVPLVWKR